MGKDDPQGNRIDLTRRQNDIFPNRPRQFREQKGTVDRLGPGVNFHNFDRPPLARLERIIAATSTLTVYQAVEY